jgi:FAD synthase
LTFIRRLREERKFPNVDALRQQIALDVDAARAGS